MLIRGSHDFDSKEEYEAFVAQIIDRRNRRIQLQLIDEQRQLQALPVYDSVNYNEYLLKVSTTSTIQLRRVTYSVSSRLIGSIVKIHLYDKTLEVYCEGQLTLTLERIYTTNKSRAHQIDYRHMIKSLMKKPRAFRGYQWRDAMFPNADYEMIWKHIDKTMGADDASYYMVRLLHIASQCERESALARFVMDGIRLGQLPTVFDCEDRFLPNHKWTSNPVVEQHPLATYQAILEEIKYHAN